MAHPMVVAIFLLVFLWMVEEFTKVCVKRR